MACEYPEWQWGFPYTKSFVGVSIERLLLNPRTETCIMRLALMKTLKGVGSTRGVSRITALISKRGLCDGKLLRRDYHNDEYNMIEVGPGHISIFR
jgi:hypothetical protein